MYNNEVTYNEAHNTEANKKALEILQRKYFDKSECSPDCPVAWAPEVLEMMDFLQKELGFAHNEGTMRGYYVQGKPLEWFILNPIKAPYKAIKRLFEKQTDWSAPRVEGQERPNKSFLKKLKEVPGDMFGSIKHSISYGIRASVIRYVNPIRNRIEKPRIRLGQLKEKYGELRCYFHTSEAFSEFVENEVRKCEIKLALKGVYYPLEGFYEAGISYNIENEYHPDSVTVTDEEYNGKKYKKFKKTSYRKVMKELGVDLEALKQKIFEDNVLKDKDGQEQ